MPKSSITRLSVKNYRSVRNVNFPLGPLNILVGEPGSGKSVILSAIELLGEFGRGLMASRAAELWGADNLTCRDESYEVTMSVGMEIQTSSSVEDNVAYEVAFERKSPEAEWHGREHFYHGKLAKFPGGSPALAVARLLKGIAPLRVRDLSVLAGSHRKFHPSLSDRLCPDGSNLADVLYWMSCNFPSHYGEVVEIVRSAFPHFRDLSVNLVDDVATLRWTAKRGQHERSGFDASSLSGSTARFLALATLLTMPDMEDTRFSVIVLDEPELGLPQHAISHLGTMLRRASLRTQVVVATQSPTLMTAVGDPEAIVVVSSNDELGTTATRLTDRWSGLLVDSIALGAAWEQGLLDIPESSREVQVLYQSAWCSGKIVGVSGNDWLIDIPSLPWGGSLAHHRVPRLSSSTVIIPSSAVITSTGNR